MSTQSQAKLIDPQFSITKSGDQSTVSASATTNPPNQNVVAALASALKPVCIAIEAYLDKNPELYPQMLNNESVDYSKDIIFTVQIPFATQAPGA